MVPRNTNYPFISAVQGNVSTLGIISFPGEKSGFPICANYCKQTCHSECPLGESVTTYFPFSNRGKKDHWLFQAQESRIALLRIQRMETAMSIFLYRLSIKPSVSSVWLQCPKRSELGFLIFLGKWHLRVSSRPAT